MARAGLLLYSMMINDSMKRLLTFSPAAGPGGPGGGGGAGGMGGGAGGF